MFEVIDTGIDGYLELQPPVKADERGVFVKTYHHEFFAAHGLEVDFKEQYYSFSRKGILRGMHFQVPPFDHAKVVYCPMGEIVDVAVDLRRGSRTYGQHRKVVLSADRGNQVYLARGLAHGFYVQSDAVTVYNVTTAYVPSHDTGIRWDSIGIDWPNSQPGFGARCQVNANGRFH